MVTCPLNAGLWSVVSWSVVRVQWSLKSSICYPLSSFSDAPSSVVWNLESALCPPPSALCFQLCHGTASPRLLLLPSDFRRAELGPGGNRHPINLDSAVEQRRRKDAKLEPKGFTRKNRAAAIHPPSDPCRFLEGLRLRAFAAWLFSPTAAFRINGGAALHAAFKSIAARPVRYRLSVSSPAPAAGPWRPIEITNSRD